MGFASRNPLSLDHDNRLTEASSDDTSLLSNAADLLLEPGSSLKSTSEDEEETITGCKGNSSKQAFW